MIKLVDSHPCRQEVIKHGCSRHKIHERYQKATLSPAGTLAFLSLLVLMFNGCGGDTNDPNEFLNTLADTIIHDENRLVFLTDGTGGYYFDDAFRAPRRREYGYSRGERRILSNWSILNATGNPLDTSPKYTIIHPTNIQYHYANGMVVTIQMPVKFPGLIIKVAVKDKFGFIFRPHFDMRRLGREETPAYIDNWFNEQDLLVVARTDSLGGWTAVSTDKRVHYRSAAIVQRTTHNLSRAIGSPDESILWSPGEFQLESGSELTVIFSWGQDLESAIDNLDSLKSSLADISEIRGQWAQSVLNSIQVKCDDWSFIKSFAWARLVTAQLIVENEGRNYLLNGIPFQPYTHGFYTCFSLQGLLNTGLLAENAISVLDDLMSFQNTDELSDRFGMVPGAITEDGPQYKIPEIAGMVSLSLKRLDYKHPLDTAAHVRYGKKLYQSLMGTARYRLYNGLVNSKGDEYLLWDSPLAPDRPGATFESQVLFGKLQGYILRHPYQDAIDPEMPSSLLFGVGTFNQRQYNGDLFAVGASGNFTIPVMTKQSIEPFRTMIDRKNHWMDNLQFLGEQELGVEQEFERKSSSALSMILAMYINNPENAIWSSFEMDFIYEMELMGISGLRSRAPQSENFNQAHVYLTEGAPAGTKTAGDILVWSACILADIWRLDVWEKKANWLRINELLNQLNRRILWQGVVGGLTEAEEAEPGKSLKYPVGNNIFLASNAEYLRLVTENILGIVRSKGIYLVLRPHFPKEWGPTEIILKIDNGTVTLKKINQLSYSVTQVGVLPYLELSLEFIMESNDRVFASARIYPQEKVQIHIESNQDGRLTARTEKMKDGYNDRD